VITCRRDDDWNGLVEAMGRPGWALEARFDSPAGRQAEQDLLDERLAEWTRQLTDREVMTRLQAAGVPAGMMMYISDQPQDPHFQARGYILELDQPGIGAILLEGPAFHASHLPPPITFPAPLLGQHTREICSSLLGYDEARIGELLEAGVLVQPD
jgi:benzylsuccinate CoA-transferase BbsF subunit